MSTISIDTFAEELMQLKNDHKQFKKDNKEMFTTHRQFNKSIKEKSIELIASLKENNVDKYEYQGMEFEVKTTHREKHNMDRLTEMVGDTDNWKEYVDDVRSSSSKVATRKAKRARTDVGGNTE